MFISSRFAHVVTQMILLARGDFPSLSIPLPHDFSSYLVVRTADGLLTFVDVHNGDCLWWFKLDPVVEDTVTEPGKYPRLQALTNGTVVYGQSAPFHTGQPKPVVLLDFKVSHLVEAKAFRTLAFPNTIIAAERVRSVLMVNFPEFHQSPQCENLEILPASDCGGIIGRKLEVVSIANSVRGINEFSNLDKWSFVHREIENIGILPSHYQDNGLHWQDQTHANLLQIVEQSTQLGLILPNKAIKEFGSPIVSFFSIQENPFAGILVGGDLSLKEIRRMPPVTTNTHFVHLPAAPCGDLCEDQETAYVSLGFRKLGLLFAYPPNPIKQLGASLSNVGLPGPEDPYGHLLPILHASVFVGLGIFIGILSMLYSEKCRRTVYRFLPSLDRVFNKTVIISQQILFKFVDRSQMEEVSDRVRPKTSQVNPDRVTRMVHGDVYANNNLSIGNKWEVGTSVGPRLTEFVHDFARETSVIPDMDPVRTAIFTVTREINNEDPPIEAGVLEYTGSLEAEDEELLDRESQKNIQDCLFLKDQIEPQEESFTVGPQVDWEVQPDLVRYSVSMVNFETSKLGPQDEFSGFPALVFPPPLSRFPFSQGHCAFPELPAACVRLGDKQVAPRTLSRPPNRLTRMSNRFRSRSLDTRLQPKDSSSPNFPCSPRNHRVDKVLKNGFLTSTFHNFELLGRGGQGLVIKGTHLLEKTSYAIKLIRLSVSGHKDITEHRYFREVMANIEANRTHTFYTLRYIQCWVEEPSCLPNFEEAWIRRASLAEEAQQVEDLDLEPIPPSCTREIPPLAPPAPLFMPSREALHTLGSFDYSSNSNLGFLSNPELTLTELPPAEESELSPVSPSMKHDLILLLQMEYCHGLTLHEWLHKRPHEDRDEWLLRSKKKELTICRNFYKAIRELHRVGIVHRDLKPTNIFIENNMKKKRHYPDDYILKIADFGLAEVQSETIVELDPGRNDKLVGTPGYRSPDRRSTPKSDVFSSALVLLEILLPPFTTFMEREVTMADFKEQKKYPPLLRQGYPGLEELLWSMVNSDANDRPNSHDVYRSLRHVVEALQTS